MGPKRTTKVEPNTQQTPTAQQSLLEDNVLYMDEDEPTLPTSSSSAPAQSPNSLPQSTASETTSAASMKLMLAQLKDILDVLQSSATKQSQTDLKLTSLDTKLAEYMIRLSLAEAKLLDLVSKTTHAETESKHLRDDMTDTRMNALELKLQTAQFPPRPQAAVSTYSMLELARLLRSKKYNKEVFPGQDEEKTKRQRRRRRKTSKKLMTSVFGGHITKKLAGKIRRKKNA
jgi:hypothetical protein